MIFTMDKKLLRLEKIIKFWANTFTNVQFAKKRKDIFVLLAKIQWKYSLSK